MSSEQREHRDGREEPEQRLADPDNYNLRRRLRQLHDAREYVKEVKNETIGRNMANSGRNKIDPDPAVAEAVTDYVDELLPILSRRDQDDEFLEEEIDGVDITVGDYVRTRGRVGGESVDYQTSMVVWRLCNRYFEQVAGPEFEDESLPKELGFQTTEEDDDEADE